MPQGGQLAVYDLPTAVQGAFRDPRAAASYYQQPLQTARIGAQDFLNKYGRGALMAGAALPAVGTSLEELQEGRPLGAVAALAPAGLSTLGAGMIGRTGQAMIGKGGLAGTAFGLGLMGLGAILPGATAKGAEAVRQKVTGEPTTGGESLNTEIAKARKLARLENELAQDRMTTYVSGTIDLEKAFSDQQFTNLQRNIPLINKLNDAALVRQQALLNTQNQAYLQQGMLANAGALARGAQAETGATVRTALTSNPYSNVVMQAPQIRFG
jgi:hypothetical protein